MCGTLTLNLIIHPLLHDLICTVKVIYPKEKRAVYINPFSETPEQIKKCKDITRQVINQW